MAKIGRPRKYPADFWSNVEALANGCWIWTGSAATGRGKALYGKHWDSDRQVFISSVHRYAYEQNVGPIPDGYEIDHSCKNTLCVFPGHLEAVTPKENVYRSNSTAGVNVRKTECKNGHPYDKDNTILRRDGSRYCKICTASRSTIRTCGCGRRGPHYKTCPEATNA